ncbi:restriction endonuclease subunit S [Actibacterium pelagium]|uniref:Type I restriction modification DNA specificity domain-containing protein n=1 Tax=Actibacterium pelagium TaxID=2029103 RepID=A0A917AJG9_9RHOB|nr:restriction endonuclease subunit S [Actibacterium pelagium]GGE55840.1 hypothetical protein GCM10011517_24350 [Actibacterium pelagium]
MSLPKTVQPGKPKLPEPPSGWAQSPLGNHLTEIRRPAKLADDDTYSLVTVKRARGGVVKRGDMTGKEISVKSQFYLEPNDFLVSKRQIVHGACGVVPKELAGSIVSNEYSVFNCRDTFDLNFLKYLSHSVYFQQTCFHSSIGVHVEKLIFKVDQWLKWNFNVPPLAEQKKIAKILSTWDQAIDTNEQLIKKAYAQKKALLQGLFPSEAEMKTAKDSGAGLSYLRDVCEFLSGPAFESDNFAESGLKLLRGSNIKRGELDWSDKLTVFWPSLQGLEKYLLRQRDVVIAMDGYVGRSHAQIDDETANKALLVQRVARLRPTGIDPDYLYALVSSERFFRHCERRKTATAIAHITMEDIRQFPFIKVDQEKERLLGRAFATINSELLSLNKTKASLLKQKTALMQQLLTGKRRVKLDGGA